MTHELDASVRVALAGFLHDLGKLAERAGTFSQHASLEDNKQVYCPFRPEGSYFTHSHAAHTALAFDDIEALLPDTLKGETFPFTGRVMAGNNTGAWATDSLVNAAAAHHKPETFLQWIVATADRVASGFEREEFEQYNQAADENKDTKLNHYTSRQLTLFEQIQFDSAKPAASASKFRYPLRPLAPANLFPMQASACEKHNNGHARAEYLQLWEAFKRGLASIPASHRRNLALWLDHFDSLWLTFTHAIPAATAFGVKPEVSLYDHSRTTAALATALWRWHQAYQQCDAEAAQRLKARSDFAEQKFLLIQGDFFGIQDFVFANGGETRKHAAKLLRGRSFQVSLFTEVAALKLLDDLSLPPTSQIINAAGKFLIVAPNTPDVQAKLQAVRRSFDTWFLDHTFGQAGIGLAWTPAACNDFLHKDKDEGFARLMQRLIDELNVAKHRRFNLCANGGRVFTEASYAYGPCQYNGRLPADRVDADNNGTCAISRDQKTIGEALIKFDRLLALQADEADALRTGLNVKKLELPLFGYTLAFTQDEDITGKFGELASSGSLRRCWDFSAPAETDVDGSQALWSGYARRFISGYVPRATAHDLGNLRNRYLGMDELPDVDDLKPLDMLACEDRCPDERNPSEWLGIAALGVLKGDVDNLGEIFRVGTRQPSFAKYASLSRQMNAFFAIWLPWRLAQKHPATYTVFAGGDDFFLIGPWRSIQRLAADMQQEFARYVAGNPEIHFSAGIATQKPGSPIHTVAELAEEALGEAKAHPGKNAITCFGETLAWSGWPAIESAHARLGELRRDMKLSTAYVYGLLQFVEMEREARAGKPEAAIWRSRFQYRTRRFVVDKLRLPDEAACRQSFTLLVTDIAARGIGELGSNYRIVLFNHLYQFRDR